MWSTQPLGGPFSLKPTYTTPVQEQIVLAAKQETEPVLSSDSPFSVDLGTLSAVNVLILKTVSGGPCSVQVTWANGTLQTIPFDSYLILMSLTNPITALTLTRAPAVASQVYVFLGQKS